MAADQNQHKPSGASGRITRIVIMAFLNGFAYAAGFAIGGHVGGRVACTIAALMTVGITGAGSSGPTDSVTDLIA